MNKKAGETRRLGRGLSSLIPSSASAAEPEQAAIASGDHVQVIPLQKITPNTFQPRTAFDPSALEELASSIRVHGVLQPVMVRPHGTGFELIAGERRYRAAQLAGIEEIPAIVRETNDEDSLAIALIENIQREDLNAIEAARGYRQLLDEFHLTQSELSRQIGKAQPTISNALRLLKLSSDIQESIFIGQISEEHGKALLAVADEDVRDAVWRQVVSEGLGVAETRRRCLAAGSADGNGKATGRRPQYARDVHWGMLEDRLRGALGLKVVIKPGPEGRGAVQIEFSGPEDLDGFLEKLNIL